MSDEAPCDNPHCHMVQTKMQDEIAGHLETIRRQSAALGQARRKDPDKKFREHAQWDHALWLFKFWQRATGHIRSKWTVARFRCALDGGLLDYEDEVIMRAITGIAANPFFKDADWWETLWKPDGIERYANRAPDEWRATIEEYAEQQEKKF